MNLLGTAQLVLCQRLVKLAVTSRRIVEIRDGLMQLFRRESGHHLLKAAECLGALIKVRGRIRPLETNAVFNMVIHPPAVARLVLEPVLPVHSRNQTQGLHRMNHPLSRIPGHIADVFHQGRDIGEYVPVYFLQLIHIAPVRDNAVRLVDMSEAIALTGYRFAFHTKCVYSLFHVPSS